MEFGGRIEVAENPLSSSMEAVIEATSIDTGNGMRDGHLRSPDFLDVDVHPEITYRSEGITPAGEARWTVHGELVLHGVARSVDLDLSSFAAARTRGAAYGRRTGGVPRHDRTAA